MHAKQCCCICPDFANMQMHRHWDSAKDLWLPSHPSKLKQGSALNMEFLLLERIVRYVQSVSDGFRVSVKCHSQRPLKSVADRPRSKLGQCAVGKDGSPPLHTFR